jgi:hypothetical protein
MQYLKHIKVCPAEQIACQACGLLVASGKSEAHMQEQCPERKASCRFCGAQMVFRQMGAHEEECASFPVPCPNECQQFSALSLSRSQMAAHMLALHTRSSWTCSAYSAALLLLPPPPRDFRKLPPYCFGFFILIQIASLTRSFLFQVSLQLFYCFLFGSWYFT